MSPLEIIFAATSLGLLIALIYTIVWPQKKATAKPMPRVDELDFSLCHRMPPGIQQEDIAIGRRVGLEQITGTFTQQVSLFFCEMTTAASRRTELLTSRVPENIRLKSNLQELVFLLRRSPDGHLRLAAMEAMSTPLRVVVQSQAPILGSDLVHLALTDIWSDFGEAFTLYSAKERAAIRDMHRSGQAMREDYLLYHALGQARKMLSSKQSMGKECMSILSAMLNILTLTLSMEQQSFQLTASTSAPRTTEVTPLGIEDGAMELFYRTGRLPAIKNQH